MRTQKIVSHVLFTEALRHHSRLVTLHSPLEKWYPCDHTLVHHDLLYDTSSLLERIAHEEEIGFLAALQKEDYAYVQKS